MTKTATLVNFGRYIDVKIGSLADSHIKQFGLRLAAGERGDPRVNSEECQKYLSLWESIQAKEGKNLNAEEHAEVMERSIVANSITWWVPNQLMGFGSLENVRLWTKIQKSDFSIVGSRVVYAFIAIVPIWRNLKRSNNNCRGGGMADTEHSKCSGRKPLRVQVPPSVPGQAECTGTY